MDFDKVIQTEGKRVAQILDDIFRTFDQFCASHGIQKIETVGKTYMACAGLKSVEMSLSKNIQSINPIRRILDLALDMEEFIKRTTYGDGIPMKIRIGIHYGKVIAGVIGFHKPQFSLIGDTVNTTSRVCTANNPGQIRMSEVAYKKMMALGGPGRSEIYFIAKVEYVRAISLWITV
jgi:Adenylate cyclase, family 3 (some proteins contain HAMP domain)